MEILSAEIDRTAIGSLTLADEEKESSAATIGRVKGVDLRVVTLSRDREKAARAIAALVGIEEVIAGVLPTGKSEVIGRLQGGGVKAAMAEDGLNDASALENADVGIATATGSDLAIEVATLLYCVGI